MVHRHPLAEFFIELEEGHLDDPEQVEEAFRDEVELLRHGLAQCAEDGEHVFRVGVADDEDEVALFGAASFYDALYELFCDKFIEGSGDFLVDADPGKAFRADAFGLFGQLLDAFLRHRCGAALRRDGADRTAALDRALEDAEAGVFDEVGDVVDLHAVTGVGLVGAVALHGVLIGQARQRQRDVDTQDLLERAPDVTFDQAEDVLHLDEGHLEVDLREFRLAVRAKVFVAEAAGDLHVAVKTGDHGELLVELRALGQRIEFAVVETGRNEEVPGAFRRGLDEHRGLDLDEPVLVEVVSRDLRQLVAKEDILL